jgi:hypothetical protein
VGGSIGVRVVKGVIQYGAEVAIFWVGFALVGVIVEGGIDCGYGCHWFG